MTASERGQLQRLLEIMARGIAAMAGLRLWQFNVGVRLQAVDLLVIGFVAVTGVRMLFDPHPVILRRVFRHMAYFQFAWAVLAVGSGIVVLVSPVADTSMQQFLKVALGVITYAVFSIALLFHLELSDRGEGRALLRWFAGGAIVSCLYLFLQVGLFAVFNIDPDALIWDQISFGGAERADHLRRTKEWGPFVRGTGLMGGADTQAVFAAMAVPLLLARFLDSGGRERVTGRVFIALVAIAMTMSRSGLLSLVLMLLVQAAFERRQLSRLTRPVRRAIVPALALGVIFWPIISVIVKLRLTIDTSRVRIYQHALEVFADHPLGIGLGNFAVMMNRLYPGMRETNPHNSWIGILVELGAIGVTLQMALMAFLVIKLRATRSTLGNAVAAVIIGVAIGSLLNSNLDLFAVQFFIAVGLGATVLEPHPLGRRERGTREDLSLG